MSEPEPPPCNACAKLKIDLDLERVRAEMDWQVSIKAALLESQARLATQLTTLRTAAKRARDLFDPNGEGPRKGDCDAVYEALCAALDQAKPEMKETE